MLLAVNFIVFAVYWLSALNILLDPSFADEMVGVYDIRGNEIVPGRFVMRPIDIIQGQRLYTLFTSMFTHIEPFHLMGNMLFLYIFGDNVEDALGHGSYLAFYLVSGLAASLTHIASIQIGIVPLGDMSVPVIGASGAISGVLGAYIILYPKARILTLVLAPFPLIVPLPAVVFLGLWFVTQWLLGFFDIGGGVAYWAHIGGFAIGMALAVAFGLRRKRMREAKHRL